MEGRRVRRQAWQSVVVLRGRAMRCRAERIVLLYHHTNVLQAMMNLFLIISPERVTSEFKPSMLTAIKRRRGRRVTG